MEAVTIYVHPLSRAVLTAHYGEQPFILLNHDPLFDALTAQPLRPIRRGSQGYSCPVTFVLSSAGARALQRNALSSASRLFRQHKQLLCWYVAAIVQARGKGAAMAAVHEWRQMHGVTEDDYETDAAYKLWQRFGWELEKKNNRFSAHLRARSARYLSEKKRRYPRATLRRRALPETPAIGHLDQRLAAILAAYQAHIKRMPKCLPRHLRAYIYKVSLGYSDRVLATMLARSASSVNDSVRAMRRIMARSPLLKGLVDDALNALPVAVV